MIAESGLSEWLSWLQQAQNQQGFVISRDKAQLQTLFMEGEAAYLVGKAAQLTTLQEVMGVEAVGVVPLPSGAPLLGVDLLMIHQQANEEEQRLGLTFAEFLTDIENQLYFIEQANQIPVNINVDITPFPAIDGFVQQLEFVTVLSNRIEMQPVFQWGELVYEQVFENGIDPIDAVADFANTVDVTNGLDVVEVVMPEGAECVDEGKLALWHSWSEPEAVAWQQVIADFVVLCPNIEITTTFVEPAVFTAALTETLEVGSSVPPPDFFIGTHNRLGSYLEANLVRDIASLTDSSELTAYVPKAVAGFSLGDQLYGLPSSMNFPVLYYRSDKIVETATTFDNLLDQANDGVRVGMNASFTELLWGASAFGCGVCASAEYFDDQNVLSLSATELAEWGAWLKTAKVTGQFIFDDDEEMLATLFIDGKIDYLVAGSQLLNTFQAQLGRANVGVTVLPNGPDNQLSTPTMQVSGFLFFLRATEKQTELALRFARFATQQDSQTFLMQAANFVPTNNLAVISADDPTIRNFTDAIERTVLRLSDEEIARIAAEESFIPIFDGLATSANEGN
ncbi:MAG TPA: extracellular solute-binding protein [Anaerolineae bacterium]|nr:extracellular solute-binding protein [Anaerolineae bacterium]